MFGKAFLRSPVQLLKLALVDALRIVLVQQFLPFDRFPRFQMADNLARVDALLFAALLAVGSEGVREGSLQFPSLLGAGSLVQQTFEVVAQDSVVAEDLIHVDVVELIGVLLLLGGNGGRQRDQAKHNQGEGFHFLLGCCCCCYLGQKIATT